ncbi:MAG: hypothetical protein CMD68_00370 [Gammaproteobacteria bacterium]|nr:hypothetical protein [Gammaproteobacteria bacterium]
MKKAFITFLFISFLISQTSPIDIATTGANKLRMYGQLNIFQNPATLGYSLGQIKLDSSYTEVSLDDFNENLEETEDLENAVGDSLDNEFSEFDDDQDDFSDTLSLKIEEEVVFSDLKKADSLKSSSNFSMSLFSVSLGLGSGSLTPDWISNQLFGGRDLRNIDQRKSFLKGISKDINLQVPLHSSIPLINFSFGSNVISLGQVVSYTSVNIPKDLAQVPFIGLEKNEELNINSLSMEHITYLPVSYSKGFALKPGLIPFGKNSYAGVRANLLIGLAELHIKKVEGIVKGTETNTLIDADIEIGSSLPVSIDDSVPEGSIPIGLGIDLGVITEIDEKLSIGLSLDNLLASFNWDGATVYSARAEGEIKPDEITEADSLSDLLSQSELKESSSYKTSLPTSMNLSGTYKADDWITLDANIRIDLGDSYWASKSPLISISSEFFPSTKAPIYLGVSFGGENNFVWGTGISLRLGSVIFDVSGGQLGGLFNNATGMQFGFGLRIQK